ncbi:hypothetical protein QR680_018971 [Steinernema hermaphroditum]|uniref:Uncharacterized protein n=1 Tax=Steinernema hermaphroditum TaxID=289476 RepID=A0AA39LRN2_9BILA|nr:hypothetical protein QR680_018971 [Steinernema hermaphroditum]
MPQQLSSQVCNREAATLLSESLDRLNAIRFRAHQENSKRSRKSSSNVFEEFVRLADDSELMTVVTGHTRAYFFSTLDSWMYLERDAESNLDTLYIVRENADGVQSIQKTVC